MEEPMWRATDDDRNHIVAVLHCAEAMALSIRAPVVVTKNLKYYRESSIPALAEVVIERIDPYKF